MSLFQIRSLERREFMLAGAAGLAWTAVAAHAGDATKGFNGFEVGIQSWVFREFSTEQALKRINDLGVGSIEFSFRHLDTKKTPEQIAATLRLCKEYKVKPAAAGVFPFTANHDTNRTIFEFGKTLGIQMLSADPTPDSFDSLDKLVEEFGITIGIHPHGPMRDGKLHRWYSAEAIMKAVKDHNPKIGSCLDTGHLIRAAQLGKNLDPATEVRVMGARNHGVHLKDHDNKTNEDVVFGKGPLDVVGVLRALKEVGFKGCVSIEYEANPKDPMAELTACVDYLGEATRKV